MHKVRRYAGYVIAALDILFPRCAHAPRGSCFVGMARVHS